MPKSQLRYYFFFIAVMIGCLSCISPTNYPDDMLVKHYGALKDMMRKGDIAAKTELEFLKDLKHIYALGAIENLQGEIQIFDSQPYNTRVSGDSILFENTFSKKATLLVYATVENWQTVTIPESVISLSQLEKFILSAAKENQVDKDHAFPFLLKGSPESFDWHVINWKEGDTEHSHEKHINSGLNGKVEDTEVEMLGFYSKSHRGIFTHHTSDVHIHVRTTDNKIAGHVDDIILGNRMTLELPKSQ